MTNYKKITRAFSVILTMALTLVSVAAQAGNQIVVHQQIVVNQPILADKPESGYQFFHRFAPAGDEPQCNLHIVSKNGPVTIEAGTVLNSTAGIQTTNNTSRHPLNLVVNRSILLAADVVDGVEVSIRCSDEKSILTQLFLKTFDVGGINDFTLPSIEVR